MLKLYISIILINVIVMDLILVVKGNNLSRVEQLPADFPRKWLGAKIPYAINLYSPSPKRLVGLVRKGIDFLVQRSCLKFQEKNPIYVANLENYTYLYFTYSGVLEDCCLPFFTNPVGRRFVLLTPACNQASDVAHAILHGLGVKHKPKEPIGEDIVSLLFYNDCANFQKKYNAFFNRYHW